MFPGINDLNKIGELLGTQIAADCLKPLVSSGLTHDHIVIGNTGWMLRLPRNNQLGLSSSDYLLQQKTCYDTAEKSGVTPVCRGVIPPSPDLPNGALIIQYIKGRGINSENDLPAVAKCLAAMSAIQPTANSDLVGTAATPFASQWFVIHDVFGNYFDSPHVAEDVRRLLKQEKAVLKAEFEKLDPTAIPLGMIGGDSHLGNYLIDDKDKAWFVDLEFLTFDVPAIDAADAISSLTSRLDHKNKVNITSQARDHFYQTWLSNIKDRPVAEKYISLAERAVTLRTLAWMCYWVDQGKADNKPDAQSRAAWDNLCAETLTPEKVAEALASTKKCLHPSLSQKNNFKL